MYTAEQPPKRIKQLIAGSAKAFVAEASSKVQPPSELILLDTAAEILVNGIKHHPMNKG
jgi:hypothetical protein